MRNEWKNFVNGNWQDNIDVENFIELNYKEYTGDSEFLKGKSNKTAKVWDKCLGLLKKELKKY